MTGLVSRLVCTAAMMISSLAWAAPVACTATGNLDSPESVYYDSGSGQIFVSNVAGDMNKKDGNGFVATINTDKTGKVAVRRVVEGLNAPKGLRSYKDTLWVADIDTMVKIDVNTFEVIGKIPVPGALFLNDVAVASDGSVYVSDTIASRIYLIMDNKVETFVEGKDLESPNGLLVVGDMTFPLYSPT